MVHIHLPEQFLLILTAMFRIEILQLYAFILRQNYFFKLMCLKWCQQVNYNDIVLIRYL